MRRLILWELSERLRMRELLTRLYRADVRGTEHVPQTGPCIFVANHDSLLDPWFLCLATPRRVRFMAKAELWRYPGIRWAMEAYGTFPVERGNGDTGAMGRAGELLAAGEATRHVPPRYVKAQGQPNLAPRRRPARAHARRPDHSRASRRHAAAPPTPAGPRAGRGGDRGRARAADDRRRTGIDGAGASRRRSTRPRLGLELEPE